MAWRSLKVSAVLAVGCAMAVGCGGKVGGSGTGGAAGAGGTGASAGSGGTGASAGSGGTGASAGSGGTGASAGSGGTGASAGSGGATCSGSCIVPPPPSNAPPNTSGTRTVIEVSRFYLGDRNQQGQLDPNAWKHYGYDLDGLDSTGHDQNHCTPAPGANPVSVKTDGAYGIDNSFGENLLPLYTSLAVDLPSSVNQWLADGKGTQLIQLDNLVDPALAPNQNGISAARYVGANKGSPAAFGSGGDVWPVTYESVVAGNINAPLVTFPKSYVSSGVWVSGGGGKFVLALDSSVWPLVLPLSRAVITMRIKGAGKTASAVQGTIAGVMNTEAYVAAWKKIAGSIDTSLCDGPTFDSVAQQLRAASDIMSDGSNGDPSKTCDAISVGIGFDGIAAQISTVAPPVQPTPDPCAP